MGAPGQLEQGGQGAGLGRPQPRNGHQIFGRGAQKPPQTAKPIQQPAAKVHHVQPGNAGAQRDGEQFRVLDRSGPVTQKPLSGTLLLWQLHGQFHKKL
ncbi:hypothetical protein D3C81_2023350 [compost metagenome]